MSTVTQIEPTTRPSTSAYIIAEARRPASRRSRTLDRHTYDQLSEAAGERQPVHLIYDGKDLEIVVSATFTKTT